MIPYSSTSVSILPGKMISRECKISWRLSKESSSVVNSRWLSLFPVIERVLEQYAALHHYFTNVVSKQDSKTDSYYTKKIFAVLNTPLIIVRLHSLKSFGSLYTKFLTIMQSDEPLIYLLYDQL